ncbi:hypothetical protein L204_105150 [Cryptococcus depauperatus]|nr:hypothetical protein L204_03801 [Cryptococcus depauperatus CBS 7855]
MPPSPTTDIANLSLPQVNTRLERNAALLASPLFSGHDPVRIKLEKARQDLLTRQQELMMQNMSLQPHSNVQVLASGKQRALQTIKQSEVHLAKNSLILPIDQTLLLGQRDYINQTAASLSSLSINPTRSISPKPRLPRNLSAKRSHTRLRYTESNAMQEGRQEDEIARAERLSRLGAFMSYKGDSDEQDEWSDSEDDYYSNDGGDEEGYFDENGMPKRRRDATGEQVDEFGLEDDEFQEGNDEYQNGAGDQPMSAAPDK